MIVEIEEGIVLNNGKTTGSRDKKLNFVSIVCLLDDRGQVH